MFPPLGDCYNKYFDDARCDKWAADGDCEKYGPWMKRRCQRSCKTCGTGGNTFCSFPRIFSRLSFDPKKGHDLNHFRRL